MGSSSNIPNVLGFLPVPTLLPWLLARSLCILESLGGPLLDVQPAWIDTFEFFW